MIKTNLKQSWQGLLLAFVLLVPWSGQATTPVVMLPDFSVLAEQSSPSVVNISTTKKIHRSERQMQMQPQDMLRYFFGVPRGQFQEREFPHQEMPEQKVSSLGSGFIISSDGYIVTNNHVIEGADDILIKMRNHQEVKAVVIGTDKRSDVALLKVNLQGLPVAKIGHSSRLKVGQWVLAIGEPFGLDYTVSHGIISALGRSLPDDTYVPFIQTDVSINPGNSGGPLINMSGEVVGINSQIYSKSGGSMGLSFSIPIDLAMNVVHQLKSKGKVERGYLGVQVQAVSNELAKSFGLKKNIGALVAEAIKGGAADKAGVRAGDIILSFNGRDIAKSSDLPPIVGLSPINKPLDMVVLRNGKQKTITVRLQSLSQADQVSAEAGTANIRLLNASVQNLSKPQLRKKGLEYGVQITEIRTGVAQKMGLLPGDIIVTVNFQKITSVKVLHKVLKRLPKGEAVPVRVVRKNRSIFLPLVIK